MRNQPLLICVCLIILGTTANTSYAQSDDSAEFRAALERYCVTCHNETLKTASLMLDKENLSDLGQSPHIWEKVLLKLQTRSMPPVGMPRPEENFYIAMSEYLENGLDALSAANPEPGRTITAHRLNRTEYTNVIRDLLEVNIDGASLLPPDNSGGFDNLGELLSVSPVLMEKYLSAAREISRLAVGDMTVTVDSTEYVMPPSLGQSERMSEDLPFGTRGGMAFSHRFPLDGEYTINIRLQRNNIRSLVVGIDRPHWMEVRIDGKRVKLFRVGGENPGLALGIGQVNVPPSYEQFEYERNADKPLEIRFPVTAGEKLVQVAFLEEEFAWEETIPPRDYGKYSMPKLVRDYERAWIEPSVSNITLTGPYNAKGPGSTPSRDKIFICKPEVKNQEEGCAQKILSRLARQAYRRPVAREDMEPLLELYRQGNRDGGSFESGIQTALEGLLVSAEFLFRIRKEPATQVRNNIYAIDDIELASRLSFFLWSSIPDDELLLVAETGKLRQPEILEQQVRRMLKDDKALSLVSNFAEQWLLLRNLPHTDKNQELFPAFDEGLRAAFQKETELFLASIFQEDRSILELFRADYKYVNERLAQHYGIDGVYGTRFRRVSVEDEDQKGLLAQAAVLAITSYPNRTSPVLRGKWVLENILASPPPPPPANIPALKEEDDSGKQLSMREAIEKHRANPACATCHNRMDPIGFGLENFNPIGQWRTEDAGKPIDSSGMLPDGSKFQGPAELQKALLSQSRVIVSAFTQKLLVYALGRDLEYYDMPAVRHIVANAHDSDYRLSEIVSGIVNSLPFQMRRTDP